MLGSARHPTPRKAARRTSRTRWPRRSRRPPRLRPSTRRSCRAWAWARPASSTARRHVRTPTTFPGWIASFPLAAALQSALGTKVTLGNDVGVATAAELSSARAALDSLLGVFWGTGIGGGLILDSRPWHGRGGAGEIGHTVIREGGRRCPCGRRGCLEAYAGRAAMEARARRLHDSGVKPTSELAEEHGRDRLTSGIWERALEHGDRVATKLIDRAVDALGVGIASAVNLLDVEAVVIGGGLGVRSGEPYRARIVAAMLPHSSTITARPPCCSPRSVTSAARTAPRCSWPDGAGARTPHPGQASASADAARQARLAGRAGARRARHAQPAPAAAAAPLARLPLVRLAPARAQLALGAALRADLRAAARHGPVQPVLPRAGEAGKVKSIATKGDTIEGTFKTKVRYPAG